MHPTNSALTAQAPPLVWAEKPLRILVACEFSGRVRDACRRLGHDAWSCDLLPTERPGPHYQEDVFRALRRRRWDVLFGFPSCRFLAVSGARWWAQRRAEQREAIAFFRRLDEADVGKICLENPIGILSTAYRKPDQIIQPWWFGDGEVKATCLWLRNLPLLVPTDVVDGRVPRVHREPPGPDRWKNRSRTYPGVAGALASQMAGRVRRRAA